MRNAWRVLSQPRILCRVETRRWFAYEDTLAFRLHGPKPLAIVIHPILPDTGRKPLSQILLDAEEAIDLARATRWDILPGPNGEPRGGWDDAALAQAEALEQQRREESSAQLVPEGWHLDRGEEESDDEYDVWEEAWRNEVIRRQWAETCVIKIREINPGTFFGKGKVTELALYVADNPCRFVFVNTTLTPTQTKNLEFVFNNAAVAAESRQRREEGRMDNGRRPPPVQVFDRNRIVLELFQLRAKTPIAKVQVSMARLEHMKTRLTLGTRARLNETLRILQDQVGPFKQVSGYNTEVEVQYHYEIKPFETERILLREAERRFKKALLKEKKTRELHRRGRVGVPTIGIVGYTNVGKTTLMNRLTGADLKERNILFQTLETTFRRVYLPSGNHAIVADSIGFIQQLPHSLFAAYEMTLEELVNCDVLLHVRDISHPHRRMHKETVLQTLESAGVPRAKLETSVIEVWNKIDLLPALDYVPPEAVPICASDGTGVVDLMQVLDAVLMSQVDLHRRTVSFPEAQMKEVLAFLHQHGSIDRESLVVEERAGAGLVSIDATLPSSAWRRWRSEFAGLLPPPSAVQPQ